MECVAVQTSLIKGTIWRSVLLFTLPVLGGMLLQQLYSTVDGMIVGNFVSSAALGAIGTCAPLNSLLLAVATGFSSGFGVVAAQYYGAKKHDDLRHAYGTALILMIAAGLAVTGLGLAFGQVFLQKVLSVPPDVLDMAVTYLYIYCAGMLFQFLYNAQAAALRALGDSSATMLFLLVSTVVNVALDLLFVVVFSWGVAGAAAATVLAQLVSVIAAFVYAQKKYELLRLRVRSLRFDQEQARLICRLGIPSAFQTAALAIGSLFMQRLVNSFGSVMLEGYTAGYRVESFVTLPVISFNVGLATFTGQNIGAGQMKRVKTGHWQTLVMAVGASAVIAVLVTVFAGPLVKLFGCSGEALEIGQTYLRFIAKWFVVFAVLFVTKGLLHGAGDVTMATVITVCTLVLRVGSAYLMASFESIGRAAVWYALAIDFATGTVLILLRYLMGGWKKKALVRGGQSE